MSRVEFMREAMRASLADQPGFNDQQAEDVVVLPEQVFGRNRRCRSRRPRCRAIRTPAEFSDEALKIVYVDYDMPGPTRFPWTAHPDKDGNFWIRNTAPRTGSPFQSCDRRDEGIPVPNPGPALIHSAVPAPDGSVWVAEAGSKKLGRWTRDRQVDRVPARLAQTHRSARIRTGRSGRPAGSPASIRRRKPTPQSRKCRPPTASPSTRRTPSGSPR